MGQREAIAFGDGVAATMRMKFEQLQENLLPGSKKDTHWDRAADAGSQETDLASIVGRMRNTGRREKIGS